MQNWRKKLILLGLGAILVLAAASSMFNRDKESVKSATGSAEALNDNVEDAAVISAASAEELLSMRDKELEADVVFFETVNDAERALKSDTAGGKSPEETLGLYLQALKENNPVQTAQYFMLNTDPMSEDFLTRTGWEVRYRELERRSELQELYKQLSRLTLTFSNETEATFQYHDKERDVLYGVRMALNPYAGLWKLTSEGQIDFRKLLMGE